MNYLSVENLSKSYNEKVLFEDITFGLEENQKTAIVGVNGAGKSTLLRIIAGLEAKDQGVVSFKKDIQVAILPQNPVFDEEENVLEAVFSEDIEVLRIVRDYEMAIHQATIHPEKGTDISPLLEKMDQHNAWDYENQVKQILGWLGIENFDQKIKELSGGQRKRVAMARALVVDPDLLILDEPTNHLDLETIERLEEYLINSRMTLLMVTHDRYFLDKVTNDIIELDNGKIFRSKGNYTRFLENKEERQKQLSASVEKAKNLLRKETEWIRRQPKARGTKAKYRVDAYEELKEKASTKVTSDDMVIRLANERQGKKILELENISKSYGDKTLLDKFSYTFKKGDRIGIVGKNGIGKSTFLDILSGRLKADSGKTEQGVTINMGYFTQEETQFDPNKKVLDIIQEVAEVITLDDGSEITASQLLNQFLFPPKVQYNLVGKLSGGEKKRLQLLRVLMKNPNFLILDEPTNDFDLATLSVLENYLESFDGCLIIVSHDRYFMDRLVDHLFIFEGQGKVSDFPGNYSIYRDKKVKEEKSPASTNSGKATQTKAAKTKDKNENKLSYSEKREYEQLMSEIEKLESRKAVLTEEMNRKTDFSELEELGKQVADISRQLDEKEMRWLELSEREN
ncbi:MAG: ABC-F family ATP-binding cassette domain-containing protein [Cyclobacteriaceae bacterium]|nr:ABC-F family ATP-binding cassette domain-containing protein [Cyclobacteriaceae bacterium SS2]